MRARQQQTSWMKEVSLFDLRESENNDTFNHLTVAIEIIKMKNYINNGLEGVILIRLKFQQGYLMR